MSINARRHRTPTGGSSVPDLIDRVYEELSALPPRRGLFAEDLPHRIGPILRGLAGIAPEDDEFASREKLVDCLDHLLWTMPEPERQVISVAIGMHPKTKDLVSLALRLEYLQADKARDARTVRRWLKTALHRLAKSAAREITEGGDADTGWYVESLRSVLRLDLAAPVAYEERRIVATRHGLRELTHRASLPRVDGADEPDRRLEVDLDYGGRMRLVYETDTDFRYVIALSRPLDWGERHEFRITTRLPPGHPMAPHYTCVPQRRFDYFELRVRFDRMHLPGQVRRIDGGSPRSTDGQVRIGELLVPDGSGEVCAQFSRLNPGRSYGLQWAGA
jgi:hypothetical protein